MSGLLLFNNECWQKCPTGLYSSIGVCVRCNSSCLECVNASACSSCPVNAYLHEASVCVYTCPDGYYALKATCEKCLQACSKCTDTGCLACQPNYSLYGSSCVVNCPKGTFNQNGICLNCSNGCSQCNATACLCCDIGLFLVDSGNCL